MCTPYTPPQLTQQLRQLQTDLLSLPFLGAIFMGLFIFHTPGLDMSKFNYLQNVFRYAEDVKMLDKLKEGGFDRASVFLLRGKYSPFSDGGELIIFVEKTRHGLWVGWGYQDGSAVIYRSPQEAWDDLEEMGAIHLF